MQQLSLIKQIEFTLENKMNQQGSVQFVRKSLSNMFSQYDFLTSDAKLLHQQAIDLAEQKFHKQKRLRIQLLEILKRIEPHIQKQEIKNINLNLTTEQQNIVNSLLEGKNIIVDSVPGSGKTTLILSYISEMQKRNKTVLAITFSARLKEDSRKKLAALLDENYQAPSNKTQSQYHSFHSFCNKFFYSGNHTDSDLQHVLKQNTVPKQKMNFDTLIIDEAQDITPVIYKFLQYALTFFNKKINICFIGDQYQAIHQFLGSSAEYFLEAKTRFQELVCDKEWKEFNLSLSFRLPQKICNFVNEAQNYKTKRREIKSAHGMPGARNEQGILELFLIKNTMLTAPLFNGFKSRSPFAVFILQRVQNLLKEGVSVDDIFMLFPSTKNIGFLQTLKIAIADSGLSKLFYVSQGDAAQDEVMQQQKKIIITTYHQSKGLERDYVFVFYFDSKYVEVFHKTFDYDTLNNEHYVAMTRAKKCLYLISADASYDDKGQKKSARLFNFMPASGYDMIYYFFKSYKKEEDMKHNDNLVHCFHDFIQFMKRKYVDDSDFKGVLQWKDDSFYKRKNTDIKIIERRDRGLRRFNNLMKKYLKAWQDNHNIEEAQKPENEQNFCNFDKLNTAECFFARGLTLKSTVATFVKCKELYREQYQQIKNDADDQITEDIQLNNEEYDECEEQEQNIIYGGSFNFQAISTQHEIKSEKENTLINNLQRVDDLYVMTLPQYINELQTIQINRGGNKDTQFISDEHFDFKKINRDITFVVSLKNWLKQYLKQNDPLRYEQIKDSDFDWFDSVILNRVLCLVVQGIKQVVLRDIVNDEITLQRGDDEINEKMRVLMIKDYEARLDECLCNKQVYYQLENVADGGQVVKIKQKPYNAKCQFIIFGRVVVVSSAKRITELQCKTQMKLQVLKNKETKEQGEIKVLKETKGQEEIKGYVIDPLNRKCTTYKYKQKHAQIAENTQNEQQQDNTLSQQQQDNTLSQQQQDNTLSRQL